MLKTQITCLATVISLAIAGCGGGTGDSANSGTNTTSPSTGSQTGKNVISGVLASGAPILGTVYLVSASTPSMVYKTSTDTSGQYTFDVTYLRAPYLLRGESRDGKTVLYSVVATKADGTITANITPFSTYIAGGMVMPNAVSTLWSNPALISKTQITQAKIDSFNNLLKSQLAPAITALNVDASTLSFISTPFPTNHAGVDALLDQLDVRAIPSGTGSVQWEARTRYGTPSSVTLNPIGSPPPFKFDRNNIRLLTGEQAALDSYYKSKGLPQGNLSRVDGSTLVVQLLTATGQIQEDTFSYASSSGSVSLLSTDIYQPEDQTANGAGCSFDIPMGSCVGSVVQESFSKQGNYWKASVKAVSSVTCSKVSYNWIARGPSGPGNGATYTPAYFQLIGRNTDHETLWGTSTDATAVDISNVSCTTYQKEDQKSIAVSTPSEPLPGGASEDAPNPTTPPTNGGYYDSCHNFHPNSAHPAAIPGVC